MSPELFSEAGETIVWFQVLGHVSARGERGPVSLGSARQRAVLAVLLVEPGVPVSSEQLVERVWGTAAPRSARQTLHSYLSRLRSVLQDEGGPALARRSGGYVLDADESTVDLLCFRALVARARQADDDHAEALWREAMALWQGVPFAGLDSDWLRSLAVTLAAERQAAALDHHDLLLRRGEHARLLPSVAEAARESPLDERLAGQLMLALYRCGRQSDALEHYRQLRERLADELGSDPGPELRELYQCVLRQDPQLAPPAVVPASSPEPGGRAPGIAPSRPSRPAQLPLDVTGFTGRAEDLRRLDRLVTSPAGEGVPADGLVEPGAARAVVITAIGGTAGVGKTALAVHWAHRVADRFPDGQLYVNLRGYDPEQPMRPADALARFLSALGVPERDIPLDDEERAARYRSELAGRRMLIVLDNAGSAAQVRPLLPGSGASMVVVTSRDSLAGLVAVHGAHQVGLDVLSDAEAVDLLHRLIGGRVAAEPKAAQMLAEQCARLPLALRVAAVLATSRPDAPLADVVAELADRQERLELLDAGGDPYAAVHAVFSWSLQHLPEQAARTFRRLGLHPGPDLDHYAAAALTGLEPQRARRVLETLASAHLLHRTGPGRYGMHDLLRAYAAHLALADDTAEDRETACDQLLGYYQLAAHTAVSTLFPAEVRYRPDRSQPHAPVPDLTEPRSAREWLQAERSCLVAIAEHAADHRRPGYVVGLARVLHRYVNSTRAVDLATVSTHALRAAEEAGDLNGQAHALRQLGVGYIQVGQYGVAAEHLRRALVLFQRTGDSAEEALTLTNLATIDQRRGDHRAALDGHYQALALARQAGDRFAEATALTNLAGAEDRLGDNAKAYDACQQALAILREIGAMYGESIALNNLANAEMGQGRYALAHERLRRSLAIIEALDVAVMKGPVLESLGELHLRLGEPNEARDRFQQAVAASTATGAVHVRIGALNGLGETALLAGSPRSAIRFHSEALGLAVTVGIRDQQARAHAGTGHAHRALGDADLARTHYAQARTIYRELARPEAEDMRAWLEKMPAA